MEYATCTPFGDCTVAEASKASPLLDRRRIVDLRYLCEQLNNGCTVCERKLSLCRTLWEKRNMVLEVSVK